MSNIAITRAPSGLLEAAVVRTRRVSPHVARVTLGGGELRQFQYRGFDQWFRLAIPVHDGDRLDNLPQQFGLAGYMRYRTLPKGTRPVIRNYTVRAYRPAPAEIDVDFIVHGSAGVAGPWASTVQPGAKVALIDQGCGFRPQGREPVLLVADESGMPAVAAILRDLPRQVCGHAILELFDTRDRQELHAPEGVSVHWVQRAPDAHPGSAALPALRELALEEGTGYAFAVGESSLAVGARRHLVGERGMHRDRVTFCGYWKRGRAAPS